MADPQSTQEILSILERIVGESVRDLQVLGINSLKSVVPAPSDLVGATITSVGANQRIVQIDLGRFSATFNLERTGRLVWLDTAEPAQVGRSNPPTVRLLLESGSAVDFTEPARTKRISVTLGAS